MPSLLTAHCQAATADGAKTSAWHPPGACSLAHQLIPVQNLPNFAVGIDLILGCSHAKFHSQHSAREGEKKSITIYLAAYQF
uniref:Uncharacterized protein n=1 Tax=Arundo donax TaxID=35708 RepID=A0A0A9GIM0_ARUDO